MSILRAAILVAVLAVPGAASATSFDEIAARTSGAAAAQTLADALISRRPLSLEVAAPDAQRYFDFNALLTLGALVVSIAGFAAFARRPRESAATTAQTDGIVRWMQIDLAHRIAQPRDAA